MQIGRVLLFLHRWRMLYTDDATQRLHDIVSQVKESPEVRDAYMMWEKKIFYERRDAITEERIRAIKKKLEKNKSPEKIADELEIHVDEVKEYISLIQG